MSVISGVLNADAAESSANTQADAIVKSANIAAQTQMDMFNKGVELTEPWRVKGAEALDTLANKIAQGPFDGGEFDFEASPGYDFRMTEGQKALERSAAARGRLLGGATQKALLRYGQDYATGEYDKQRANALREYYESLTPLQSMAGVGQSTASQTAGNAMATGAGIANTQMQGGIGAGNAIAAGQINRTNAITGAINATTNNALLGYDMWRNNQTPTNAIAGSTLTSSTMGTPAFTYGGDAALASGNWH